MNATTKFFVRRLTHPITSRNAVARISRTPAATQTPMAAFSTECAPAQKLRMVLEEYRQTKYVVDNIRSSPCLLFRISIFPWPSLLFSLSPNPHFLPLLLCAFLCNNSFSDEIPSRFRKHIIKEIEDPNHETFHIDNLNPLLENIGRHDARLTQEELDTLLKEAGVVANSGSNRHMPIDKMLQLM